MSDITRVIRQHTFWDEIPRRASPKLLIGTHTTKMAALGRELVEKLPWTDTSHPPR